MVSFRRRVSENNFFFVEHRPCDGYTAGLDTASKQSFGNNVFLSIVLHSREIQIDSEALIEWST